MNGGMAVGADCIYCKGVVPDGYRSVAGETKLGRALIGQHMTVDRAMGIVASCAALNSYCCVLVDERTLLIRMAFEASFILEPIQS